MLLYSSCCLKAYILIWCCFHRALFRMPCNLQAMTRVRRSLQQQDLPIETSSTLQSKS